MAMCKCGRPVAFRGDLCPLCSLQQQPPPAPASPAQERCQHDERFVCKHCAPWQDPELAQPAPSEAAGPPPLGATPLAPGVVGAGLPPVGEPRSVSWLLRELADWGAMTDIPGNAKYRRALLSAAAALSGRPPEPCQYGDPACPCQDGDQCHYEGENPMTPERRSQPAEAPPAATERRWWEALDKISKLLASPVEPTYGMLERIANITDAALSAPKGED